MGASGGMHPRAKKFGFGNGNGVDTWQDNGFAAGRMGSAPDVQESPNRLV